MTDNFAPIIEDYIDLEEIPGEFNLALRFNEETGKCVSSDVEILIQLMSIMQNGVNYDAIREKSQEERMDR